tara:strand:+ start:1356 stop:1505 length:150 start_codon:yes stop_codon:yes gene_type:complete
MGKAGLLSGRSYFEHEANAKEVGSEDVVNADGRKASDIESYLGRIAGCS